jgi:archaellin
MSIENQDVTTTPVTEEEEFEIEIRTQKGSSIKIETTSYNKLDDLLEKAFTTYQRLAKEESGGVDEKLQYQ